MSETTSRPRSARVYTSRDDRLERALERARSLGFVDAGASDARALHALVMFADEQLLARSEADDKLAAYERLAEDDERRADIYAGNLQAFEDGLF